MPKYHRPALPVPAQFPYANSQATASAIPAYDIGWKDFFQDPRLQKLIDLSLKNNRDYRIALLNVQEIQSQYRIVRYGLFPSFEAEATGVRERSLGSSSSSFFKSHTYNVSVNTAYEVDLFGHIRSLQTQTLEQYFATQEASRAEEISLVSEVAVQYLIERALDEQLALLQQTLNSVESYHQLIQKSYQLGNATALEVQLAQVQVKTIQANIAGYRRQRAQADDALVLLVGEPLPADLPPPQALEEEQVIEDLPVGLSSDLLERRPDILQAEHQLKAANANIGVVRSHFFPSLTLTASDGTASTKLSKLFTSGSQVWNFSPQITLPLFNENTNLANLNAAWVSQRIAIAQYERAIQQAFKEVSDALVARDAYNAQVLAQRDLVKAQQERYHLSGARYHNGVDNYLTVLLAQQDLYNAQNTLIQVSLDRLTNLISLYKALGGGWKEK